MPIKNRFAFVLACWGLLGTSVVSQAADDFVGTFSGEKLSVELKLDNAAYTGTIHLGAQDFPLTAHLDNAGLKGTFSSGGNDFTFTATVADNTLTLITGGATYVLKKATAPVNPLAAAQPINPLGSAAANDAPAGYTIINTTTSGKALATQKAEATTVMAAMKATFPDLEKYFGARPAISGAYEDAKEHKTGSATFTVDFKGKPMKGIVSCKINNKDAAVAVIFCNADASPADWAKLTTDVPAPAPADATASLPPLTEYKFADGTGSIGLADGWTTQATSCMQGIQIKGPADQIINIGVCVPVQTPDSQLVQMHQQLVANARQLHMQPPPPMKILIAPYTGPVDAMNNLVPQFSRFNEEAGSFAIEIDNAKELPQQVKPNLANSRAALVSYGVTHIDNGNRTHFLAGARVETTPIGNGAWMYYVTEIAAPDKTFENDTPLMLAMVSSLKENAEVIAAKTRQNMDDSNRRFAEMQQAHKEQLAGYDRQNKASEQRSLDQSRRNADFVEVIRGDRTVIDTQTGNRTSVDLGNVDGIVNHLNEADPGRYQQIPLRDEMYPQSGK